MTIRFPTWPATWLLVALTIGGSHGARAAELRLRSQCTPAAAIVVLGDVAEIFAADEAELRQLGGIELFPAPQGAAPRFLRLRELQDLLILRGVNLTEHRLSGSNQVTIQGIPIAVHKDKDTEAPLAAVTARKATQRVHDAILQYLRSHSAADEAWTITLELTPAQSRALAAAAGKLSVAGGAKPWTGTQRFEVSVAGTSEQPLRFNVDAQVTLPPAVVVTVRALLRGAVIRETNVELQRDVEADNSAEVFASLEEVVGQETTRAVSAGKPLPRDSVRAPLLVHRGDVVTVYSRSPGIQIRTTARAKDEGSLGELIAVESFHNREAFYARVSAAREVEMFARAPQVAAEPALPAPAIRTARLERPAIRLLPESQFPH